MIVNIQNENYGYSVATHDDWVVVGNPASFRYDDSTPTAWRTGSVDIFKYNTLTNQHDLILTLYKPLSSDAELILSDDDGENPLHTDIYRQQWLPVYHPITNTLGPDQYLVIGENVPIKLDIADNISTFEDDYGHSVDVYNNVMAVGGRWYNQEIQLSDSTLYVTGSSIDIYNLTALQLNPLDGYIATGSAFLATVLTPPDGEPISGSFGFSTSINDEWLAVGSPEWNNTLGGVHMYRRNVPGDINDLNFTFFSTITGSAIVVGDNFGYAIDVNKHTGSYSGSLIVGCGNNTYAGSKVYYFEFNGTEWAEQYVFEADRSLYKLPFYDVNPIPRCENYTIDGFGNSVALYGTDVAIGAPTDRWIYEYSGSRAYKQGACYLFHRCDDITKGWSMIKKFYGGDSTLKNNKMGFSVDLWDDKFVVGCPKDNVESMDSCYIEGSIWQQNYCYSNFENYVHGQWIFMQKNTSSADVQWDVANTYQRKKRFLSPYRAFGFDVAVGNKSIVIGAPMIISDTNRSINISNTGSCIGSTVLELGDITGKSYIYNITDFRDNFHVGNVFYRNGKVVLNTSGSVFEGLWFNPITEYNYEYELHFDSKQTLYEKQIACVVEPGEFNVSTNPTAIVKNSPAFDINENGTMDWQDLDVMLRYMQYLNTRYDVTGPSTDWSSSLLSTVDEITLYNFNISRNAYYNTESDFISSSFFKIINGVGTEELDFNQDSKIDLNDMNILWKYYTHRLTQTNYHSYITTNSKRKLFSDIITYLDTKTQLEQTADINPHFLTYNAQSALDRTGSYLAPYVTTIGLYSGLDIVATAKLGSPIKLTGDYPMNFIIKIDF